MKMKLFNNLLFLSLILSFTACQNKQKEEIAGKTIVGEIEEPVYEHILTTQILTKEEQERLTPDMVLKGLIAGNKEFTEDRLTVRNNTERVREASLGQHPEAVILSCLDSRVPVEDVFHKGIGDLFVARVAGNIVNDDILGSLEYACKVSGSKLIVVLGHEHCGAIKSAIDNVELGNITGLLSRIQPAVTIAEENFSGDKTSKNPEFVESVCYHNIEQAIKEIREKSPILKEMENAGEIKIVGGIYDMETGVVTFSHK